MTLSGIAKPSVAKPRALTCARCGAAFECGSTVGKCWCAEEDFRLPMPPEARPKSVTLEFHDHADGKWTTQVNIVNPDGSTLHSDALLPLDGTPGPVTGDYWADVSAMKMPPS